MLNRLFSSKADKNDGLTQAQREAIVDLLHYCMYADSRISLSESSFVAAKVQSFNWDPKISFESYQGKSIGVARNALSNADAKKNFFESVKQRVGGAGSTAYDLCQKLFAADGKTESEAVWQADVKKALGV
jgi:hypothetical protein